MSAEARPAPAPQAAIPRGNDYRHPIAWLWISRMLSDPARCVRPLAAAALILAVVAAACSADDPTAAPVTGATTTTSTIAAAATTTSAAAPEPPETPTTTEAPPALSGDYTHDGSEGGIRWSGVFDGLSAPDRACIRGLFDEGALESGLDRVVFSEDFPTDQDVSMFECLAPETADDILAFSMASFMESEVGVQLSDRENSCLGEWTAGIDLRSMVLSATASRNEASAFALFGGLAACVPDAVISLILADHEVGFDGLADDQRTCLREWLAEVDWEDLAAAAEDSEAGLGAALAFMFGLLGCLPDLGWDETAPLDGESLIEGATPTAVGEPIEGALASIADANIFVFEAAENELYSISVSPGTLDDPTLALFDADGIRLDSDDDSGDGLAPRLYWEALSSGPLYVEVGGYGSGSYTLTVERR